MASEKVDWKEFEKITKREGLGLTSADQYFAIVIYELKQEIEDLKKEIKKVKKSLLLLDKYKM